MKIPSVSSTGTQPVRSLLVPNFVPFADKAFLVLLPHVREQFITAKEALATKFAQRMGSTFNLVLRCRPVVVVLPLHRREMYREQVWRIQGMLMGKDFLEPDAEIAGQKMKDTPGLTVTEGYEPHKFSVCCTDV